MANLEKKSSIILALDVLNSDKAIEIANKLRDEIDAIKINYPLVLNSSPEIVSELSKIKPVICDFKVADIPYINSLITKRAIQLGASGIICHSFVGLDSLKSCIENANGKDVFVVVEMSHPGGNENYGKFSENYLKEINGLGISGIIAPATRVDRIKYYRTIFKDKLILSPGVGAQGGKGKEVLDSGADFLIIGRSLYNSDDPKGYIKKIK